MLFHSGKIFLFKQNTSNLSESAWGKVLMEYVIHNTGLIVIRKVLEPLPVVCFRVLQANACQYCV